MKNHSLFALSPLDGRYAGQVKQLGDFFSEAALIKYRIHVEASYFVSLLPFIKPEQQLAEADKEKILNLWQQLQEKDYLLVKEIENRIKHDTKAVEYFFKRFLIGLGLNDLTELVHFGLTSEDINNIAYNLMLQDAVHKVIKPALLTLMDQLTTMTENYAEQAMLARTHGQTASPTTLGKEIGIYLSRLLKEVKTLLNISFTAKLNGATGNYNALYAAYPDKDWLTFSREFLQKMGLSQNLMTTQIEPHDTFADFFDNLTRLHNILLDLNKDFWHYISLAYFHLEKKEEEVGSSTMPHKINPIDFENSEGNLGIANSLLTFMKNKLCQSRLQRDLSDSTVLRNIGVALGHSLLAYKSTLRGLQKLKPAPELIEAELNEHPEVLAEAIQTILRAENVEQPYELLKSLTRGQKLTKTKLDDWINQQDFSPNLKQRLLKLSTREYTGIAPELARRTATEAKNFLS